MLFDWCMHFDWCLSDGEILLLLIFSSFRSRFDLNFLPEYGSVVWSCAFSLLLLHPLFFCSGILGPSVHQLDKTLYIWTFCSGVTVGLNTLYNWTFCSGVAGLLDTLYNWTFCSGVFWVHYIWISRTLYNRTFCSGVDGPLDTLYNWTFCSGVSGGLDTLYNRTFCSGVFLVFYLCIDLTLYNLTFCSGVAGADHTLYNWTFCSGVIWVHHIWIHRTLYNWTFCSGVSHPLETLYNLTRDSEIAGPCVRLYLWTFCRIFCSGVIVGLATLYNRTFCSGVAGGWNTPYNQTFCGGVAGGLDTLYNWTFCSGVIFANNPWACQLLRNPLIFGTIGGKDYLTERCSYSLPCSGTFPQILLFDCFFWWTILEVIQTLHGSIFSVRRCTGLKPLGTTARLWDLSPNLQISGLIYAFRTRTWNICYTFWWLLLASLALGLQGSWCSVNFNSGCILLLGLLGAIFTPGIQRCRSGPKSRRHPVFWYFICALLVIFTICLFTLKMDDRGEGCGPAVATAEVQPDWVQNLIQHSCTKQHGIQPTFYGSRQTWRSSMTPVVKRSLKRAFRRSCRDGISWYKGRCLSPSDFPFFSSSDHICPADARPLPASSRHDVATCNSHNQDHRCLRVMVWNCGGLAVAKLDEIKLWLAQQRIDVALLIETRWTFEGESQDDAWLSIHTGSTSHRGMGILCLVAKRVCKMDQLRWRPIVEGRLLHVQLRMGSRCIDILGCYQHTQASNKLRQQERLSWWNQLDQTLNSLARRNVLIMGGDFNCSLPQASSYTGPAEFRWKGSLTTGAVHADQGHFLRVIKNHGITALNTWDISLGPTFVQAQHCSRIDFMFTRKPHANGVAKDIKYVAYAPFVQDNMEGHIPMVGQIMRHWIPPSWDNTVCGINQQQRIHGRSECIAQSEQWQGFMQDTQRLLVEHLQQASTQQDDFIPRLHQIAGNAFNKWFPSHALKRTQSTDHVGHRLILNKWDHRRLFLQFRTPSLRNVLRYWFHVVKYGQLKRAHHKHAKQVRADKFHAAIAEAKGAAQRHDMFQLFQIINKFAPKQPRRRMQLRNIHGNLASPSEEQAMLTDFVRQVWHGPSTFPIPDCSCAGLPFSLDELTAALRAIPATKAVARACAP